MNDSTTDEGAPIPRGPLSGRAAVITGGGRGIGAATAGQLAAAGASVVVSARSEDQIERVVAELRQRGFEAHAVVCDVTDPQAIDRLRDIATEKVGLVDVVVNNAGIASSAPLVRTSLEEWEHIFRVNVTGVFLCTRAFLPGMLESGWGRVINVASVAGKAGAAYISAYTASKHAVIGLTRAVAVEVAQRGITVNAVCPGYVDTDMATQSVDRIVEKTAMDESQARQHLEAMSPQRRLYTSDEVAAQIVHLCQPLSGGINGQSIVLDGGGFQT